MSEGVGLTQRIARLDWRAVLMILIAVLGIGVLAALITNQRAADAERDAALAIVPERLWARIITS